jgi:hypothetical protein
LVAKIEAGQLANINRDGYLGRVAACSTVSLHFQGFQQFGESTFRSRLIQINSLGGIFVTALARPKTETETTGMLKLAGVWFSERSGRRTDARKGAQRRQIVYALRQVEGAKRHPRVP